MHIIKKKQKPSFSLQIAQIKLILKGKNTTSKKNNIIQVKVKFVIKMAKLPNTYKQIY